MWRLKKNEKWKAGKTGYWRTQRGFLARIVLMYEAVIDSKALESAWMAIEVLKDEARIEDGRKFQTDWALGSWSAYNDHDQEVARMTYSQREFRQSLNETIVGNSEFNETQGPLEADLTFDPSTVSCDLEQSGGHDGGHSTKVLLFIAAMVEMWSRPRKQLLRDSIQFAPGATWTSEVINGAVIKIEVVQRTLLTAPLKIETLEEGLRDAWSALFSFTYRTRPEDGFKADLKVEGAGRPTDVFAKVSLRRVSQRGVGEISATSNMTLSQYDGGATPVQVS